MFSTPDPTGGDRRVYDVGSPLDPIRGVGLTGTQYVAELYAGSDAASLAPVSASISRFRSTTTAFPGWWSGATIYDTPNANIVLPGFLPGDVATLQVRVWDISAFSSYEDAVGKGVTGASVAFMYAVPTAGPSQAFYMEGLQAFALVPEPSVIALSLLGFAGTMLIWRAGRRR